jgi:hypothetical protein
MTRGDRSALALKAPARRKSGVDGCSTIICDIHAARDQRMRLVVR